MSLGDEDADQPAPTIVDAAEELDALPPTQPDTLTWEVTNGKMKTKVQISLAWEVEYMLRAIARSVDANICWNGSFEVNFDKQSLTIAPPSIGSEQPSHPPLSEQDERNAMETEDANVIYMTMGHHKS